MDKKTQLFVWKLLGETSCAGCKYLYFVDVGYSNYTVDETIVHCALDKNRHIKDTDYSLPYDWTRDPDKDNWSATKDSRCEMYHSLDNHVELDVDGLNKVRDFLGEMDEESISAIEKHSGR